MDCAASLKAFCRLAGLGRDGAPTHGMPNERRFYGYPRSATRQPVLRCSRLVRFGCWCFIVRCLLRSPATTILGAGISFPILPKLPPPG